MKKSLEKLISVYGVKDIYVFYRQTFEVDHDKTHQLECRKFSFADSNNKQYNLFVNAKSDWYKQWRTENKAFEYFIDKDINDFGDFFQFNGSLDLSQCTVLISASLMANEYPFVFVIDYIDKLKFQTFQGLKWEKEILPKFGMLLQTWLSDIVAAEQAYSLRGSNLTTSHEIGQVLSGLRSLSDKIRRGLDRARREYEHADDKQKHLWGRLLNNCENYFNEVEEQYYIVDILSKTLLFDSDNLKPRKVYFLPFETFLFKWFSAYSTEAEMKGIRLLIPPVSYGDSSRPIMYADPSLIEQAVYNLTNNAFKYAHKDTIIRINCQIKQKERETYYVFSVENYGMFIDEKNKKIYARFHREVTDYDGLEGMGIGLYKCKQIADAHNGNLCHKTVPIIDYNIPLIPVFLKKYLTSSKLQEEISKDIYEELDKIWKERWEAFTEDIIAGKINYFDTKEYTDTRIANEIKKPTCKVTFLLELPQGN
jgi:signal transduction histidine kinase